MRRTAFPNARRSLDALTDSRAPDTEKLRKDPLVHFVFFPHSYLLTLYTGSFCGGLCRRLKIHMCYRVPRVSAAVAYSDHDHATHIRRVRLTCQSLWGRLRDSALLVGKLTVSDVFTGLLKSLETRGACMLALCVPV